MPAPALACDPLGANLATLKLVDRQSSSSAGRPCCPALPREQGGVSLRFASLRALHCRVIRGKTPTFIRGPEPPWFSPPARLSAASARRTSRPSSRSTAFSRMQGRRHRQGPGRSGDLQIPMQVSPRSRRRPEICAERRVGTCHRMRLPVPGNAYAVMASAIASATRTARSLSPRSERGGWLVQSRARSGAGWRKRAKQGAVLVVWHDRSPSMPTASSGSRRRLAYFGSP